MSDTLIDVIFPLAAIYLMVALFDFYRVVELELNESEKIPDWVIILMSLLWPLSYIYGWWISKDDEDAKD